MVCDEFAIVIDLQFPGHLCYDASVGVSMRRSATAVSGDLRVRGVERIEAKEVEMEVKTTPVQRKLAAILSADVKGYSRLMGQDEAATVTAIRASREIMAAAIEGARGRIVDSPGDNVLAEFGSAVNALKCAVAIQELLKEKNAELPDDRKMVFRIGINIGDVIVEGGEIYGDGVNIASRLEGLADPGGICISGTLYDQVKRKVHYRYDFMGPQEVKNISEPVRAYRVLWNEADILAGPKKAKNRANSPRCPGQALDLCQK